MHWIFDHTDLLALIVSFFAVLVGLVTILIARHQSQLDTYARMHESLVEGNAARGRKLLFLRHRNPPFPRPDDAEWDEINQALAQYDTLGTYLRSGLVPRRLVLASWHHPVKAIVIPARAFVEWRAKHGIRQPWNGLDYLIARAEAYDCDCSYCLALRDQKP